MLLILELSFILSDLMVHVSRFKTFCFNFRFELEDLGHTCTCGMFLQLFAEASNDVYIVQIQCVVWSNLFFNH